MRLFVLPQGTLADRCLRQSQDMLGLGGMVDFPPDEEWVEVWSNRLWSVLQM